MRHEDKVNNRLPNDQHAYLTPACALASGKNEDQVDFVEGAVRRRTGMDEHWERDAWLALLEEGS